MNEKADTPEPEREIERWAIVEKLGHKRLAGKLREVDFAGSKLGLIEIPETKIDGKIVVPGWSHMFHGSVVYGITLVEESVARSVAEADRQSPVKAFELSDAIESMNRRELSKILNRIGWTQADMEMGGDRLFEFEEDEEDLSH